MCKCEAKSTATQLNEDWDRNILSDTSNSHVCYGSTGQWTVTKGSRSPNEGSWGQQSCLRNTRNKHTCTHTHTVNQSSLYIALFGLFIWIQEKGKGLCISHCAQNGSYTGPEPGGVSPQCVCCTICVHRSFFPSFFSIKLSLLLLLVRNNRHQQEGRGTDNELNRGSPCWTEVTGNRFRLKIGYQMTNWTMFLYESVWVWEFMFFSPISVGKRILSCSVVLFYSQSGPESGLDVGWVRL